MADDSLPVVDGNKLIEDALKADEAAKAQETSTTDKPAVSAETDKSKEDVDWKAKFEQKDQQFKEYQGGLTPKLQRLAELEDRMKFVESTFGKLAETTAPKRQPELTPIEDEIATVEREIKLYEDNGFAKDSYEVKDLQFKKRLLIRQKETELTHRKTEQETKMVADYLQEFPKATPDHITELGAIIVEKAKKGRELDLLDAEEIWRGRRTDKLADKKTKDALETQNAANAARTLTGEPASTTTKTEEDEYRSLIAPPDKVPVFTELT